MKKSVARLAALAAVAVLVGLAGRVLPVSWSAFISSARSEAAYPASPVIEAVAWDFDHVIRLAPGSDLWPLTWADDDHLYAAWGDGGGFGGANRDGRVSLGVARIEGSAENLVGTNVFGGKDPEAPAVFVGKSGGILCVNGALYMIVCEQGKWLRAKIGRSLDHGSTWTFNGGGFADSAWDFAEPGGAFAGACFLQFGRDYRGARDDFVYGYSERVRERIQPDIVMFRVPKDRIMERAAYTFFAGLGPDGRPLWTEDVGAMRPVFSDPNGVTWGMQAVYHPRLRRYLLTVPRHRRGAWGIFDAPEPWGPWTTVAYYDPWIDHMFKFVFAFNQKWMSPDGRVAWMVFSGTGRYDAFNLIKATLVPQGGR